MVPEHIEETSKGEPSYNPKMKISAQALENRKNLFHAFANSKEYIWYIQISKFIIQATRYGPQVHATLFHEEEENLAVEVYSFATSGNIGSLTRFEGVFQNSEPQYPMGHTITPINL